MALHNLADKPVTVTLRFEVNRVHELRDLLGDQLYDLGNDTIEQIDLAPYGYRWFRVR